MPTKWTRQAPCSMTIRALAAEIAPYRVNGIHPGRHRGQPQMAGRRPSAGRSHADRAPGHDGEVADATDFLLGNAGINAVDLYVDGGMSIR